MKRQFVKLLVAGIIGTAIGALGSNYDMVKSINPFNLKNSVERFS